MITGRRMIEMLSLLPAILCAVLLSAAGWSQTQDDVSMNLQDLGHGTYQLEGHFKVDGSPYDAWKVLTDYEHISDFVSSLRKSAIKDSSTDRILLEQEALGKEFVFSKRIRVLLQVTEMPYKRVVFEDTLHTDFSFYDGSWEIYSVVPGVLDVTYRLNCKRLFAVPNILAKDALKKNAESLLAEVRAEIRHREQGGTSKCYAQQ